MSKKGALIVFSDFYLPYSPSTLNLLYALQKWDYEVLLITAEPEFNFSSRKIEDPRIKYIPTEEKTRTIIKIIYNKCLNNLGTKGQNERRRLMSYKAKVFIKEINDYSQDLIIAIDFFSLWCVQQAGRSAHLLSLEILENDPYYKACDISRIKSVLIQSKVRYDYLFNGTSKPDYHIVPNSPKYLDFTPEYTQRNKFDLIYCGSALAEFGIFSCLDFISDYSQYTLTIIGAVPINTKEGIDRFYKHLIENGRLIINDSYMDPVSLTHFVSNFWVGFVFYDFYRFPSLRKFNYYTAPSGKLFQYFNSGIPVIGNLLDGFEIVNKHYCGKLVPYISSLQIKRALEAIEIDYVKMSKNSKDVSAVYDNSKYLDAAISQF